MMKKMMRSTATAAGFAALLLVGACAHNTATTEPTAEITEVTQTETVVPAPESVTVDSSGKIVAEPTVVSESTVTVTNAPLVETEFVDTTATPLTTTTTTTTTTTVAAPVPAPMMSSSTLDDTQTATTDDTTATTETETRTRLRKD